MLAIPTLMAALAQQRPIFHAEADLQHAFACERHRALLDAQVRLEVPVFAGNQTMHVDIWVSSGGRSFALELKYKKRALATSIGNREPLTLAGHSTESRDMAVGENTLYQTGYLF